MYTHPLIVVKILGSQKCACYLMYLI